MYTLRFPFELPAGKEIEFKECVTFKSNSYKVSLTRRGSYIVLIIDGFESEEKATNYVANVRSGFMWLLLNRGLAISASYEIQSVKIFDDPVQAAQNLAKSCVGMGVENEVHGIFDTSRPSVLPTVGKFIQMTGGKVSITEGITQTDTIKFLAEGMSVFNPQVLMKDQKLQTAFELYGAFYTESSERARFITLVMVLEALAVSKKRSLVVSDFLKKVGSYIDEQLENLNYTTDDAEAFELLKQELDYRRSDSIRSSVKALVFETLKHDPDVIDITQKVGKVYDKRSKLVHQGYLPMRELAEATQDVRKIVQRVLVQRFNNETSE